ncbi:MAG: YdeI/OmpD-associated family protein [Myxococcales bacterium]|nr:YdeI/OmpD-associated family protein [Myxococcales bacterium]
MTEQAPTFFPEPTDFRAWLQAHHATADHLWVGYYKKATKKPSVTWEDTVDEALCYGWIDGIRKSRDEQSYMIRFTRRKPRSVWSQRNIDLVERLTKEGRMKAEGLAAFAHKDVHPDSGYATAKYDDTLPDPMVARFKEVAGAWPFYQAQPPGYRRQAARWVTSAKRAETRERRLTTLIDDSNNGLRIKQLRRRKGA